MGLFDIANIQRRKGVIVSRLERIKREGSQWYPYALPVTAAGIIVQLDIGLLFPDSRKYAPLDYLEIVNNDPNCALLITINNQDAFYCPAGTIRTIKGKGIALWQVAITNAGAVATTAAVNQFNFKKEAMTIDKWAAEQ